MMRGIPLIAFAALAVALPACHRGTGVISPAPGTVAIVAGSATGALPGALELSRQMVVVTTPDWNATAGRMRRYTRELPGGAWIPIDAAVPVVVGRTGLAWDGGALATAGQPVKREGDGKSPAGVFPLDTAFGFAPRDSMSALRLPYVPLQPGSDCVDDEQSAHYNTVVDRARVPRVDWNSAEHMRQIGVYRIGVIVGYNATPAVPGRGSCIFLHIWSGPSSTTAGCTALDERALDALVHWLDRDRRPVIVQLTEPEYARLRPTWGLPAR